MPFVPDQPFPKATGNPIRSKDWNDLVYESQRLDTAKVNKVGDAMTGPLTIQAALNQAALGVGTASPAARLHVVDGANPTTLRVQSTASNSKARLELWSDPQGSGTEWRPGYLESFDVGGFTGGLSFMTNGAGAANRTGSVEALRLVNGKAGFGVTDPGYRIDVGDRIRLRAGPSGSAGLWLYEGNEDKAFIGMNGSFVGLWGNKGAGWAFNMDVATGNVGLGTNPVGVAGYPLSIKGNVGVNGRVRDSKFRLEAVANNPVSISNASGTGGIWNNVPGMNLSILVPDGATFLVRFQMGGLQAYGGNIPHARGEFRLLLDGVVQAYTLHEYHANGWELREVSLERLLYLSSGSTHTLVVQWATHSPEATPANPVSLQGCWFNDYRHLMAIEL
ncbi:hypothetical protein [Pyxidicoccus caerfyrddinensis]|uniref:hypothetical protein n=1 Tax=Pyxidicoccus caerfyrddinensis TaxID=2709663 RepID=UPI0013D9A2B8|nr:hypothetical protein [Pyxidicoccus caerfyrddinensis]